jgi:hypothetical protein
MASPSAFAVLRLINSSKLHGLLHRKFGRIGALEDLIEASHRGWQSPIEEQLPLTYHRNNGAYLALSGSGGVRKPRMNKRLVVLAALVAAFFLLAAISRLIMGAGKLAETSATREVPQATAEEGLDVKFVSETSPYMRTER